MPGSCKMWVFPLRGDVSDQCLWAVRDGEVLVSSHTCSSSAVGYWVSMEQLQDGGCRQQLCAHIQGWAVYPSSLLSPREVYPERMHWNCCSSDAGKAKVPGSFLLLLLLTSAFIELTFIPEGRGGKGLWSCILPSGFVSWNVFLCNFIEAWMFIVSHLAFIKWWFYAMASSHSSSPVPQPNSSDAFFKKEKDVAKRFQPVQSLPDVCPKEPTGNVGGRREWKHN